jgi:ADP-ribosylation factor GTPase-activating protein 2/3
MNAGGNQRARNFFKQHGWDEIGSDKIESKYTSRAAQLYRKQLEKDAAKAIADGAEGIESKPAAKALPSGTISNGAANAASSTASAARMSAAAGAKARLGGTRRVGGAKAGGGLGIKKISAQIDESLFDQAPVEEQPEPTPVEDAETLEEAIGAPPASSRFTMDALEEKRRPAVQRGKDGHLTLNAGDDFFSDPLGKSSAGAYNEPRSPTGTSSHGGGGGGVGGQSSGSGFGSRPMGGSNSRRGPAAPAAAPADSGAAQARFGNAKSISSSSYFNEESRETDYERQGKLQQFQGSSAISSDAYFGRQSSSQYNNDSLDASAAELVSKIGLTARQDVQQLKAIASEAGTKLSRMAQSFMRDLQGGF